MRAAQLRERRASPALVFSGHPDSSPLFLNCSGWLKRKSRSDHIGCDCSCRASWKTWLCVWGWFHGLKVENIRRLPTTSVDLHVAEVIISLSPTEFSFSPFWVGLPLPFHPSSICVGGIKVALLSSKLQISFASVHLTLCFITAARGSTRFRSALCRVISPTGCYSPLSLTPLLLHSVGRGIIFMELPLLGNTAKTGSKVSSWRM